MRLLVLGGTVYLSKAVAQLARRRGHDVTVAARGSSGPPPEGVRFVTIDREVSDGLAPLSGEAFDAVVDVARLPGHVGPAIEVLADRAGHWTLVSTASVYADHGTPYQAAATAAVLEPAPSDSLERAMDRYGANKVACENLVRDHLADRAFVVRPGLVVGPGDPNDRFGYWPTRIAEGGEVLAPGAPTELVQFIDLLDLAEWILIGAESRITGTYDAVCPPITREQFLTGIADALGAQPEFTWVPQDFLQEHEVNAWAGEESLGLWLPLPEYAGFLTRDPAASLAAGLRISPLADTTRRWYEHRADSPPLLARLSRDKESSVLKAWHARG
jgi:2'-hydroxyisoflavone reductase